MPGILTHTSLRALFAPTSPHAVHWNKLLERSDGFGAGDYYCRAGVLDKKEVDVIDSALGAGGANMYSGEKAVAGLLVGLGKDFNVADEGVSATAPTLIPPAITPPQSVPLADIQRRDPRMGELARRLSDTPPGQADGGDLTLAEVQRGLSDAFLTPAERSHAKRILEEIFYPRADLGSERLTQESVFDRPAVGIHVAAERTNKVWFDDRTKKFVNYAGGAAFVVRAPAGTRVVVQVPPQSTGGRPSDAVHTVPQSGELRIASNAGRTTRLFFVAAASGPQVPQLLARVQVIVPRGVSEPFTPTA